MIESEHLNRLKKIFKTAFNNETYNEEEVERFKQLFDSISPYVNEKVFTLEDIRNHHTIYISPNVADFIGYKREEIYRMGALAFFRLSHYSNYTHAFKSFKYGKKFGLSVAPNDRGNIVSNHCGLKAKHRDGKIIKFFSQTQALTFDSDNMPLILLHTIEDISPLFNGNHYWVRWKHKNQTFSYVHQTGKKEFSDLLSCREQEILALIMNQESNQSIATILNLSKSTIETHRKNMLRRTGFSSLQALGFIWDKIK